MKKSAINHELKDLIDKSAQWETHQSTWQLVEGELIKRKGYAKAFKATGNNDLLCQIDICNNNIKKLLAL
jgi:hypothetical protein